MVDRICELFCIPPIAIARLGGSTTPLAAYQWAQPANPRTDGDTVIVPSWSLRVLPQGTVDPHKPPSIQFRDGELLRPVCPFIEIWARVGDPAANPSSWQDRPLTPALLAAENLSAGDLTFSVEARNLKAQRRTGNSALAYGNFEGLSIRGDDHSRHPVLGTSPLGAATPMIPPDRPIPLGSVQVMRSQPQPAPSAEPWASEVDVEVIRFRFTPAAGLTYGPPQAAAGNVQNGPAVQPAQAFLNATAGWFGTPPNRTSFVIPADTFDTRSDSIPASLGVIDDTCEARVTVVLKRGADSLTAQANIFSAPPDFAPDRRPFVSIADELNDRAADAEARNAALEPDELDAWVEDLFERIYEAVSLLNVDFWRNANGLPLPAEKLAPPIVGDGLPAPRNSMGGEDALRNRTLRVGRATTQTPLPLSDHARSRHRNLADIESLRALVREDPQRLRTLVRGPFESERLSNGQQEGLRATTMRMPPFMAQSTPSTPLTLCAWQYDLLLAWAQAQLAVPAAAVAPLGRPVSDRAEQRRQAILRNLDTIGATR